MILLGYIFTIINYFCYCFGRFAKTKQAMLYWDLLSKIFLIFALYFLGSLSGSFSFIISFFVVIMASIKERKLHKWPLWYILFELLYIAILMTTFDGISSILVFANVSLRLFATWWLRPQGMRMTGIISSFIFLLYQISINNWAGLGEICVMLSNATSFMKYNKKGTKNGKGKIKKQTNKK